MFLCQNIHYTAINMLRWSPYLVMFLVWMSFQHVTLGEVAPGLEKKKGCSRTEFKCRERNSDGTPQCVARSVACNGKPDCSDGSDEEGCGSLMTMTLKPDSFHAFTEVMTLRCGLSDAEVKGGFVERDLDRHVNTMTDKAVRSAVHNSDDNVWSMVSAVVARDGVDVASMGEDGVPKPLTDFDNLHVTGEITNTPGERGYVELRWSSPRSDQEGYYNCDVTAVDNAGNTRHFSNEQFAIYDLPTPEQMAEHLKETTEQLKDQAKQLKEQTEQQLKDQAEQLKDQAEQLKDQAEQLKDLNTLVGKTTHVESGLVDCNSNSDSWPDQNSVYDWMTTTISFSTPYDTPPVVHLGGLTEWENEGRTWPGSNPPQYRNYFSLTLTSVTNTDFTVKCQDWHSYGGYYYLSRKMSANWISVYRQ